MYLILVEGSGGSSPFTNANKECRTMLPSKLRSPPREDKNLFRVGVSDTIYHEAMHHILGNFGNGPSVFLLIGKWDSGSNS